ncbi:unnamed protein product [Menidia menidia]|uniref:Elongation of very long chain fatty acids protein n=1 Tax=Menidia menidia TaxID=238744 RepID=A0A8S4BK89_9TELE|nr:unnamed protein product [Menidia menidia]
MINFPSSAPILPPHISITPTRVNTGTRSHLRIGAAQHPDEDRGLVDRRTDPWLLVYSPVPVALVFLLYLCVVWAGPRLMRSRGPVDLKAVLILYNFSMVGLSGYMCYEFLVTSWLSNYSLLCQPVDYSSSPLAMRVRNPNGGTRDAIC